MKSSGGEQAVVSRRGMLGFLGGAVALSACDLAEPVGTNASEWAVRVEGLKMAGVYTPAEPGMWAGKEASHTPSVERQDDGTYKVSCTHGMAEQHWVTTIFVEDQDGNVIHLVEYVPRGPAAVAKAETVFKPPAGTTSFIAYAYCNQHDCWAAAEQQVS